MKRHTRQETHRSPSDGARLPGRSMWHLLLLLGLVIAIPTVLVWGPSLVHRFAGVPEIAIDAPDPVQQLPGWRVGMLRPD